MTPRHQGLGVFALSFAFVAAAAFVGTRNEGMQARSQRAVHALVAGRTPIESLPFVIEESGSYYLTGQLGGEVAGSGITIRAGSVSIDLNGHVLCGERAAAGAHGIRIEAGSTRVSVRNGEVRGWPGDGVHGPGVRALRVQDVDFEANGEDGIEAGAQAMVVHCTSRSNGASGIRVGAESTVYQSSVAANAGNGIRVGRSSVVEGCATQSNGRGGILSPPDALVSRTLSRRNGTGGVVPLDAGS